MKKIAGNKVTSLEKLGYGIGNLGFGIVFQCLASYLLFYTTAVLGLPGKYIGAIMGIGVFWDAITDPLMGYISDITTIRKWGKRHLYLLIGTIAITILNYILWNINIDAGNGIKLILILVYVMLLKTSLTVYGTPYTALGAEISSDYNERTSIQSYKTVFFLIGLAFPMVVGLILFFKPTPEFPVGQLNPIGYNKMGITTSIIMLITGAICIITTKKYIPNTMQSVVKKKQNIYIMFIEALKNKYFIYIFWGYLAVNISSALIGSLGLHVFTYTFKQNSINIAITMGLFFIMSIISLPFWLWYSRRKDKQPAMMTAIKLSLVGSVMFIITVLLRKYIISRTYLIIPVVGMIGFGSGGLFMLPPSMTADTIDYEEHKKGFRSEGIYYGCMTFGYKITQSIVLFIVGILLDVIKFDDGLLVQTEFTSIMLGLILTIGSTLALTAALVSYKKYNLSKEQIEKIQNKKI